MIDVDAILKKIEDQVEKTSVTEKFSKQGKIIEVKDGVAVVSGLEQAMFSEIVEFENGKRGLILDLLPDRVGILILGTSE